MRGSSSSKRALSMNYQVARMPNDKGKVKFNLHGFFSIFPSEFKLQGIITQTTYELLEKSINVFPRKALISVSLEWALLAP